VILLPQSLPDLEKELRKLIREPGTIERFTDLLFPGVSGYPEVKLGLLCLMANQYDTPTERERIHTLLFGKPGTGKTALMFPLEQDWGAKYISMDPSAASLKSDGRKKDRGSMIFNRYDGSIVCIDDFELMTGMNTLRDVMERGRYSDVKGGENEEYLARCRLVCATNDLRKIPSPIVSRFDHVFKFEYPTLDQSMDIVRQILYDNENDINYLPILCHYIYLVQTHEPKTVQKKKIEEKFKAYFEKYGIEGAGKEGRWINSIARTAKALARLNLGDIGPAEIEKALRIKNKSDEIIKKNVTVS